MMKKVIRKSERLPIITPTRIISLLSHVRLSLRRILIVLWSSGAESASRRIDIFQTPHDSQFDPTIRRSRKNHPSTSSANQMEIHCRRSIGGSMGKEFLIRGSYSNDTLNSLHSYWKYSKNEVKAKCIIKQNFQIQDHLFVLWSLDSSHRFSPIRRQ